MMLRFRFFNFRSLVCAPSCACLYMLPLRNITSTYCRLLMASTTPHKNIETNSRFTRKIDISSHMESLNFQSGNDETA